MKKTVDLPIKLFLKLQKNMISDGYENLSEYLEKLLFESINSDEIMDISGKVLKNIELLDVGEIFSINEIVKELGKEVSRFNLHEIENLVENYVSRINCSYTLELLFIDEKTLLSTYIKLETIGDSI